MSCTTDNTCVVCFKNVDIYSIGVCDHPVCYECSTRMRVLCLQNECPICRQDLPKVIFTKKVQLFKEIANNTYPCDKQYKIFFEGSSIQSTYQKLLDHGCQICSGNKVFKTFQLLKDHMRKEHELFFCDLCVENLKIFTLERRVYNRQQLAYHRRKGDPDDKSHKGHPLCEFCDRRYMDNDELFRHLRKDHLFCHFCDADGLHQYYSSYDFLRQHFRKEHFLCEEGTCYEEKFTSAFRTEIDLKAHKASSHCRGMGKAAAKQARTLELEFTLAPRPRERPERGHRPGDRSGPAGASARSGTSVTSQDCNHAGACNCPGVGAREDVGTSAASEPVRSAGEPRLNLSDFPSLGGGTSGAPAPSAHQNSGRGRGSGLTIRTLAGGRMGRPPLSVTDENFPALSEPSQSHKVWLSVNSRGSQERTPGASTPTNFSIHVNSTKRTSGNASGSGTSTGIAQRGTNQNIGLKSVGPAVAVGRSSSRPADSADADFPALKPLDSYKGTSSDQWVTTASAVDIGPNQIQSKVKMLSSSEAATLMSSRPKPVPKQRPHSFVMEEDFPSLAPTQAAVKKGSQKKTTSVNIPMSMSDSWALSAREDSPAKSSDSEAPPNVTLSSSSKSKKKKKKAKGNNSDCEKVHNDSNKILSEQMPSNTNAEMTKKKKKQQQVTKGHQKNQTGKSETNDNSDNKQNRANVANRENREPAASIGSERKRSELQIENVHVNVDAADTTDRLLSILRGDNYDINVSKSTPAPAPTLNPPPGFELASATPPPPGFTVKLNSVARPPSNNLTFTNSSGESYPIMPSTTSNQFVQPPDFQRRNAALMAHVVNSLCDPSLQEQFRQMSISFRQGNISASDYYEHCQNLMGEKAFIDSFPEMLVLLPEINRQQELLSVYKESNSGKDFRFEVCATCRQVLAPPDLRVHLSAHALENHFPALSANDTRDASCTSAWGRK